MENLKKLQPFLSEQVFEKLLEIERNQLKSEHDTHTRTIRKSVIGMGDVRLTFTDGTWIVFTSYCISCDEDDAGIEIDQTMYRLDAFNLWESELISRVEHDEVRNAEKVYEQQQKRDEAIATLQAQGIVVQI